MPGPTKLSKFERLTLLQATVFNEQNFYWQRFAGLSALHAGLLVFVTGHAERASRPTSWLLFVLAILLAAVWAYIQLISLAYVERAKPALRDASKAAGIPFRPVTRFGLSSTLVGALVPLFVLALWLLAAATVFQSKDVATPATSVAASD